METKEFDKSKGETYKILCNIRLLYNTYLTDSFKDTFLSKLNGNPIINVILDEEFDEEKIMNFYKWKDYFLYKASNNSKELILIKKKDVLRVLKNTRASIINDTLLNQKHKLN